MTKEIQKSAFWTLSVPETIDALQTDIQNGLSEQEVKKRSEIFGANIFP